MLDIRQKEALTLALDYAKSLVVFPEFSKRHFLPLPQAPLVMVHGGAGSGKSRLISSIYTMVTETLKKPGDNPDCPYVLLTAFTGSAASNVNGQTLHTTFSFKFGTSYLSMPEKQREEKRALFQNVRMVIIDEISLISSDMLYNLDLRLREITGQMETVFGGVSVFCFGDLYQIKPTKARYVFQEPCNMEHAVAQKLRDLWKMFKVINLEENHRQVLFCTSFTLTFITSVLYSQTLGFNMSSIVCLRISLILTLITSLFNSQMFHLKVHSKILF